MMREQLTIGEQVTVNCKQVDGTLYQVKMHVRELHNPNVAGLSYGANDKMVVGICYEIIEKIS